MTKIDTHTFSTVYTVLDTIRNASSDAPVDCRTVMRATGSYYSTTHQIVQKLIRAGFVRYTDVALKNNSRSKYIMCTPAGLTLIDRLDRLDPHFIKILK